MSKLDEVLKDVTKEKSDTMEERYSRDIDTWGNKGRYDEIVKNLVSKVEGHLQQGEFKWIDLGCGPGWVVDSLRKASKKIIEFYGCDISDTAIKYGIENKLINPDSYVGDLNTLKSDENKFHKYEAVSLIDVMYYLGGSGTRDWHDTAKAIWDNMKPGTILVVADCLVRFQYREIWKKFEGCQILDEYTEYVKPVYITEDGKRRNLKIKIYKKI